jgi:hypothetical protein
MCFFLGTSMGIGISTPLMILNFFEAGICSGSSAAFRFSCFSAAGAVELPDSLDILLDIDSACGGGKSETGSSNVLPRVSVDFD